MAEHICRDSEVTIVPHPVRLNLITNQEKFPENTCQSVIFFFFLFTYSIKVIYKGSGLLDLHILSGGNQLKTLPLPSKIITNTV